MRHFHRTIASLLIAGLSFPGFADDTELYMGQITTATDVPNILFVLDRSSSMGSTVSGPEAPVLGGTRRFDHLRDALLLLLPGLNNVNVGFMTFTQYFESEVAPEEPVHYNIPLRFPIIHIDTLLDDVPEQPGTWAEGTTVRDYLYDMITNLGYHEGTPLVPAILEAGMYYTGGNLLYGDNRRNNAANRVAHPGAYTGGTVVRDAGCTDGDLGAIACQTEKIEGTPVYNQPTIGQCQQNYIVFLTDGEATQTDIYTQNAIKTFAGITNCEGSGNEICGVDMVRALYETDLAPALPGLQNVITHTIAFALEAESGRDYMQQWANAGGGNFYAADNALELLAAFQQILGSIITESTSFAAPSLSMNAFNRLDQDNQVYFALFKPELTASWDGNVKKYNICDDDDTCGVVGKILDANANPAMNSENKIRNGCGTEACGDPYVALDLWNPTPADRDGGKVHKGGTGGVLLQSVQADPINRKIYTDINGTLTEIVTANRSTLRAELGVSTDAEAETLINWIRGYQDGDPSAGVREWLLDDSLHGSPGAITIGEDESENPITKIFMTTNEGAIRMLNGETGAEEWMFIPREMLSIQQTLMENPTTTNRTYGDRHR
jgi:type IV pilus assembly protein PilY1